jgi:hypothetical protein
MSPRGYHCGGARAIGILPTAAAALNAPPTSKPSSAMGFKLIRSVLQEVQKGLKAVR